MSALTGGYLFDGRAMAQTAADEDRKQKAAKVTMLFATEYKLEDFVRYPIMQTRYKENIETHSKGQIYTKLHPAGQLGVGAALAQEDPGRHRARWRRVTLQLLAVHPGGGSDQQSLLVRRQPAFP